MEARALVLGLIAAGLLALAAVAVSLSSRSEIEQLTQRVAELESRNRAPQSGPSRSGAPRPGSRGPDHVGDAPLRGGADAAVSIVAFMDFESPYSVRSHPVLLRVLDQYPGEVRVAFRHHPLPSHTAAPLAHRAAIAAGRQDAFWEMHDRIFARPRDLGRGTLLEHAKALDLDLRRFENDLDSDEVTRQLERDVAEARSLGLTTSPVFYINGKRVSGAQPYANFKVLVERELEASGS